MQRWNELSEKGMSSLSLEVLKAVYRRRGGRGSPRQKSCKICCNPENLQIYNRKRSNTGESYLYAISVCVFRPLAVRRLNAVLFTTEEKLETA